VSRSAMTTRAPRRASRRAIADPMPPAPPVTSATWPSHSDVGDLPGIAITSTFIWMDKK
jgi:hypothetical protein